ncbi:MAG: helix-turn-helix domain-containing protein [Pseudomonadota bacterium]
MDLAKLSPPDDPAEALAAVVALRHMADKLERRAVVKALAQGWSWSDIADALGVSKQAAHKRLAGTLPATSKRK